MKANEDVREKIKGARLTLKKTAELMEIPYQEFTVIMRYELSDSEKEKIYNAINAYDDENGSHLFKKENKRLQAEVVKEKARADRWAARYEHLAYKVGHEVANESNAEFNRNTWVLCDERLPEEDGTYLVTTKTGEVWIDHFYCEKCIRGEMTGGDWEHPGHVAWKPLSEPFELGDADG